MIRLGVCTGFENARLLCDAGFDYLEGSASSVAALDDAAYRALCETAKASPIPFEAFNIMVPPHIRLTGPDVDDAVTLGYLKLMLGRVAELGARVIVFGSGGARMVPEGYPRGDAYRQINDYLRMAGDVADGYGIDIAIEPLNTGECNILNSVAEAAVVADRAAHPRVRVLADLYHIAKEHQDLDEIRAAGARMAHAHIICPPERFYPRRDDGYDYRPFLAALKGAGYSGRISVEGRLEGDPAETLKEAYLTLNPLRKEIFS